MLAHAARVRKPHALWIPAHPRHDVFNCRHDPMISLMILLPSAGNARSACEYVRRKALFSMSLETGNVNLFPAIVSALACLGVGGLADSRTGPFRPGSRRYFSGRMTMSLNSMSSLSRMCGSGATTITSGRLPLPGGGPPRVPDGSRRDALCRPDPSASCSCAVSGRNRPRPCRTGHP